MVVLKNKKAVHEALIYAIKFRLWGTENPRVGGSIPSLGTKKAIKDKGLQRNLQPLFVLYEFRYSRVATM